MNVMLSELQSTASCILINNPRSPTLQHFSCMTSWHHGGWHVLADLTPPAIADSLGSLPHSPRHSAEDLVMTQVGVFEEGIQEDAGQTELPGGVDLNSHEDMFNAVFGKVE